jgi:hypothetical protein
MHYLYYLYELSHLLWIYDVVDVVIEVAVVDIVAAAAAVDYIFDLGINEMLIYLLKNKVSKNPIRYFLKSTHLL